VIHLTTTLKGVRATQRRGSAAIAVAGLLLAACTSTGSGPVADAGGPGGAGQAEAAPVLAALLPASEELPPLPGPPDGSARELEVVRWDLGTVTLADGVLAPLRGVAVAPVAAAGASPAPLVVVLHGSHPICRDDPAPYGSWPCRSGTEIPNEEGLLWLLEAIAARGALAIAPALNVQHTLGSGEPDPGERSIEVVRRTFDALDAGALPIPPERIDLGQLVLVGHSVGGQDANLLARGFGGFERPVAGLVLVQPAVNVLEALELADEPSVVVVSECDGDVRLAGGLHLTERVGRMASAPMALVLLDGGSHNATNALLGRDAFPSESPTCDAQLVERASRPGGWDAEAEEERIRLAALLPALIGAVLGDGAGLFDETRAPAGAHVTVVPAGARVAALAGADERVLDAVRVEHATLTWCPPGYYTPYVEPDKERCHRPELTMMIGRSASIALRWDRAGATVEVPIDGAAGDVLRLRLFPDPADVRLGEGPIVLRLRAQDGSSVEASIPVPPAVRSTSPPFELVGALLPWRTVRVRLGAPLETLTLEIVAPAEGSLQVVTLGVD